MQQEDLFKAMRDSKKFFFRIESTDSKEPIKQAFLQSDAEGLNESTVEEAAMSRLKNIFEWYPHLKFKVWLKSNPKGKEDVADLYVVYGSEHNNSNQTQTKVSSEGNGFAGLSGLSGMNFFKDIYAGIANSEIGAIQAKNETQLAALRQENEHQRKLDDLKRQQEKMDEYEKELKEYEKELKEKEKELEKKINSQLPGLEKALGNIFGSFGMPVQTQATPTLGAQEEKEEPATENEKIIIAINSDLLSIEPYVSKEYYINLRAILKRFLDINLDDEETFKAFDQAVYMINEQLKNINNG